MSNTTWIALFFVAVIMFLTSQRKKNKAISEPPKTIHTTGTLPDGQYLAKYVDEQAEGDSRIIIILEITDGEHKGTKVPMIFENAAAKRVLEEANDGFVSRLAGEEVALASTLEDNIVEDAEHAFLIRTKDNKVVSTYKHNDEKIYTFVNKLAKDPSFRG